MEITNKLDPKIRKKVKGLARRIWDSLDPLCNGVQIQIFSVEEFIRIGTDLFPYYLGFRVKVIPNIITTITLDLGLPRTFQVKYLMFDILKGLPRKLEDLVTIVHLELNDDSFFGNSANMIVRYSLAETICLAMNIEPPTAHTANIYLKTKIFEDSCRKPRIWTTL